MHLDSILFDLDGTLIDTNELIIESFKYTFEEYGLTFTREEMSHFNGPPLVDTFHHILPDKADEMIQTYRKHNFANHAKYVKAFPYVREVVQQLQEKNVKVAVVSTKVQKSIRLGLEHAGLDDLFSTIVGLDDVTYAKPDPESIQQAMRLIGADEETTLMVGDNYHDIEAGHNAGIQTAGVSWSMKGKEFLSGYNPTYMLEDMRDILTLVEK